MNASRLAAVLCVVLAGCEARPVAAPDQRGFQRAHGIFTLRVAPANCGQRVVAMDCISVAFAGGVKPDIDWSRSRYVAPDARESPLSQLRDDGYGCQAVPAALYPAAPVPGAELVPLVSGAHRIVLVYTWAGVTYSDDFAFTIGEEWRRVEYKYWRM